MNRNYLRILESRTAQEKYLIAQNTRADIIGELDAIIQYERHIAEVNDAITKKNFGRYSYGRKTSRWATFWAAFSS